MFNLHLYSEEVLSELDIKPFWDLIKNLDDFISIDQEFMFDNFNPDELDDLSDDYPDLDDDELYQKQVKKSPNFKKWKEVKFAYCHHLDISSPTLVTFDWCPISDVHNLIYFLEFTETRDFYEYSGTLADQLIEHSNKIKESPISEEEKQKKYSSLEQEAVELFKNNQHLSSLNQDELSERIREIIKV